MSHIPENNPGPQPGALPMTGKVTTRMPWAALAILVLALLAYWPALQAGFIWDDDDYVQKNAALRSVDGLVRIWCNPGVTFQYYPLVFTTFWVEYHAWELAPMGYHLVNVLLHLSGAFLLWRVLIVLRLPGAWLPAAIFALHPVQVESVAWITERKNVLSGLFYFAAALQYLKFQEDKDRASDGRSHRWRYAASLGLFACALFSKTVTCSLPAALLLVRYWKKGRLGRTDWLPLLPFFALGLAMVSVTGWMEHHVAGAHGNDWMLGFQQRCWIAGRAVWFYFLKLVWPANLTFIYPRWDVSPDQSWQWIFPLGALALVGLLWLQRARIGRGPLVAALFFGGTLLPALGFVDVYPMRYSFVADHFQYLASIGVILVLAWILARRIRWTAPLLLPLLAALTWNQCHIYRDLETLWKDTIAKSPTSWMAHNNLGVVHQSRAEFEKAGACYREAIRLKPDYPEALDNLGSVCLATDKPDEAIRYYKESLTAKPGFPDTINRLGQAYLARGMIQEAIDCFREVLQIRGENAEVMFNIGCALTILEKRPEALAAFRRAMELDPKDARARVNHTELLRDSALILAKQGRFTEALQHLESALPHDANPAGTHTSLADILQTMGRNAEARDHYLAAIQADPSAAPAHVKLGFLLLKTRDEPDAISHWQAALKIDPGSVLALNSLAWTLATSTNDSLRNGLEAVRLAEKAVRLTGSKQPEILDTLAAAQAETRQFDAAINTASQARALAESSGKTSLARDIASQIDRYKAGRPRRE